MSMTDAELKEWSGTPASIQAMRDAANTEGGLIVALPMQRKCSNCGGVVYLSYGRHSGKWFWSHLIIGQCVYDQTGMRLLFDTKEQAEQAEKIWKELEP